MVAESLNHIVGLHKGEEKEAIVYPYISLHKNRFDVINSLKALLRKNCYCMKYDTSRQVSLFVTESFVVLSLKAGFVEKHATVFCKYSLFSDENACLQ